MLAIFKCFRLIFFASGVGHVAFGVWALIAREWEVAFLMLASGALCWLFYRQASRIVSEFVS